MPRLPTPPTEKVQAEIDAVIGRSRQASMDDCVNMPYTNAVIHESLRMGNVVPLSLLHATGQELHLRGYTIPKVLLSRSPRSYATDCR